MTTYEMGHRMLELGKPADAAKAFAVALKAEPDSMTPEQTMEAALVVLQNGDDYTLSYRAFVRLYQAGALQKDVLSVMTGAFYEPNIRLIKNRYERNCKLLARYPYIFRTDFPAFEDLPISFIPFNDNSYTPFYYESGRMGEITDLYEPVVRHYFNKSEDKPVLGENIFSQYELEYLVDNVRPSEWVAKENHIYLHYDNWAEFCAWLQVLNLKPLLEKKKIVFLFGDEIARYPIDFKERYGIDYSQFSVRPIGVQEVNRMIWHTQLSTHNGGDFFNEIFDAHPNLLVMPSIMFYNINEQIDKLRSDISSAKTMEGMRSVFQGKNQLIADELYSMRTITDKDLLVVFYLLQEDWNKFLDPSCRFAPAVFFQPHFHNIVYSLHSDSQKRTILTAENLDEIHKSKLFQGFKYIKTFTPMRRFTTSHGATVKFMYNSAKKGAEEVLGEKKKDVTLIVPDAVSQRVLNRSFLADPDDRMYSDSIIVRFEDGKLNPKATFTALAAFLDLPYTESMTYCSEKGERDPLEFETNVRGFDPATVYRTYDEYVNDSERKYIEYFLRDAYAAYGYDFQYYDDSEVTAETVAQWVSGFDVINHYIRDTWIKLYDNLQITAYQEGVEVTPEIRRQIQEQIMNRQLDAFRENRIKNAELMMEGFNFVNMVGRPLRLMPMLRLDPALLENEIYH